MALHSTLAVVLSMVKAELGKSLAATATAQDQNLYQLIDNQQQWLANEYDWATQAHWWDVDISTGNRFINVPSVNESGDTMLINLQRPVQLSRQWNIIWVPVEFGIHNRDYNYLNSELGVVLDPVQKWRLVGDTEFEVWPVPAGPQKLRFNGQGVLNSLKTTGVFAPTKTLDLDDLLVTYFTAARVAAKEKQADYQFLLTQATNRLNYLRASEPHNDTRTVIGHGGLTRRQIRAVPIVAVHG